jgi:hypothetical protein
MTADQSSISTVTDCASILLGGMVFQPPATVGTEREGAVLPLRMLEINMTGHASIHHTEFSKFDLPNLNRAIRGSFCSFFRPALSKLFLNEPPFRGGIHPAGPEKSQQAYDSGTEYGPHADSLVTKLVHKNFKPPATGRATSKIPSWDPGTRAPST